MKDRAAVLLRYDPTTAETGAVTRPVDGIDNGCRDVTAAQEVSVQRMRQPIVDGATRRHERLPEHLTTKYLRRPDVTALPAKTVNIQLLQPQQFQ
jgi:hypothetical protein